MATMATTDKKKPPEPPAPGSDSEYDPLLPSKSQPSNSDGGSGTSSMYYKIHADPDSEIMKSLLTDSEIVESLKMLDAAETFYSRDPKPNPVPLPLRRYSPYCKEHFGVVVGCVDFSYRGDRIDCTKVGLTGTFIVPSVDNISDIKSDALFILVVENGESFMRLAEDRFYNRIPCIIISSKGYLDVLTRLFLKKMKTELKLPVLALVDCNPLGLKILSVHMCGSKEDSSDLSIPDIKWLGFLPRDLDKYQIPKWSRRTMTEKNIKKARHLLEEDFVQKNPAWVKELELMVNSKEKAEIQALSLLGCRGRYLSRVYLPHKIQHRDWL